MAKPAFMTVDLCDKYRGSVQVAPPGLLSYGRSAAFSGIIETVKCYEDNTIVRQTLSQPGAGKVLVVDAAASLTCALVGGALAGLAAKRRWAGIVLNGCVRDISALSKARIGIRAIGHMPLASDRHGLGVVGVPVSFGGVTYTPGHYLYADEDGIVVAAKPFKADR
jgi:regulator of ribonuclease activity A